MYGDPHVISTFRSRRTVELPGFAIGIHHVTCAEYLDFLNDLLRRDPGEARRRAPRQSDDAGFLWEPSGGAFRLPDDRRYAWSARLPVFGVSFEDALAYARWRSERDGLPFDLPTEAEWEKAAKGADGRYYPWGNHFDNEHTNNFFASRDRRPGVVEVDSFPVDSATGATSMSPTGPTSPPSAAGTGRSAARPAASPTTARRRGRTSPTASDSG
jgi:serine/threonine-protein kinase